MRDDAHMCMLSVCYGYTEPPTRGEGEQGNLLTDTVFGDNSQTDFETTNQHFFFEVTQSNDL